VATCMRLQEEIREPLLPVPDRAAVHLEDVAERYPSVVVIGDDEHIGTQRSALHPQTTLDCCPLGVFLLCHDCGEASLVRVEICRDTGEERFRRGPAGSSRGRLMAR